MLLSYNLNKIEMKLDYNYSCYHIVYLLPSSKGLPITFHTHTTHTIFFHYNIGPLWVSRILTFLAF